MPTTCHAALDAIDATGGWPRSAPRDLRDDEHLAVGADRLEQRVLVDLAVDGDGHAFLQVPGQRRVAIGEERELTDAYRTTKRAPKPQGQGLNDLYVRFFRMAERKITEMEPHKGVVCFISNYSWLDGLSFTGMRERFLREFDVIRVDCLNGDKYKTGKTTPDGHPDPSIFSTERL